MFASVYELLTGLTREATPPKADPPVLTGIPALHPSDCIHDLWAQE